MSTGRTYTRLSLLALPLVLLAAGCASEPPQPDPVQQKLSDLDARMGRIEANQVEASQRIDQVQGSLRELRGRLEELEHNSDALAKQQRDLYADLDKRLATATAPANSGSGAAPAGGAPAGGAGATGATAGAGAAAQSGDAPGAASAGAGGSGAGAASSTEQAVYGQAFDALKAGSYSVAIAGFKDFLGSYPSSPLAENAQYWLGESYYVTHDYEAAAGAFRTVLKKWPDSRKAPDALLKLGYTQSAQKQYAAARATLNEVMRKYPGSDPAKLAAERLRRLSGGASE